MDGKAPVGECREYSVIVFEGGGLRYHSFANKSKDERRKSWLMKFDSFGSGNLKSVVG